MAIEAGMRMVMAALHDGKWNPRRSIQGVHDQSAENAVMVRKMHTKYQAWFVIQAKHALGITCPQKGKRAINPIP